MPCFLKITKQIIADSAQTLQLDHGSTAILPTVDSKLSNNTSQQSERSSFTPPIASMPLTHVGIEALLEAKHPPGEPIQGAIMMGQDAAMGSEDGNDVAGSSIVAANSVQILQQCQRQVFGTLDDLSGLE